MKELWHALKAQHGASNAGNELMSKQFLDYRMVEDRPVLEQAHEIHMLAKDLMCCSKHNPCVLTDKFAAEGIITKLPHVDAKTNPQVQKFCRASLNHWSLMTEAC